MVRTKDDLLSKRIEHFLHAYHFEYDHAVLEKSCIPYSGILIMRQNSLMKIN